MASVVVSQSSYWYPIADMSTCDSGDATTANIPYFDLMSLHISKGELQSNEHPVHQHSS
jgi:hypothetical protein